MASTNGLRKPIEVQLFGGEQDGNVLLIPALVPELLIPTEHSNADPILVAVYKKTSRTDWKKRTIYAHYRTRPMVEHLAE